MPIITINNKDDKVFEVILDQEDYDKVIALGKWYISNPNKKHIFYAEKQLTERQLEKINNERLLAGLKPLKKTVLMHRYVLDLASNSGSGHNQHVVDHIDGNGLNNSRSNLRICDRTQNCYNRKPRSNSQTGYRGVGKIGKNTWCARITPRDQKQTIIGYYKTAEEAAYAYDEKAKQLFGEFAKLNFH